MGMGWSGEPWRNPSSWAFRVRAWGVPECKQESVLREWGSSRTTCLRATSREWAKDFLWASRPLGWRLRSRISMPIFWDISCPKSTGKLSMTPLTVYDICCSISRALCSNWQSIVSLCSYSDRFLCSWRDLARVITVVVILSCLVSIALFFDGYHTQSYSCHISQINSEGCAVMSLE